MAQKNGSGYNRGYAHYMYRWKSPLVTQSVTGEYVWDFTQKQACEICRTMSQEDMHVFTREYVRGWNDAECQMAYANAS